MPSQKTVQWAELRVGILSAVAMVIAAVLIFLLTSQSNIFTGDFLLRTFMEDSAGMAENAPVRLNGILAGHIASVKLSGCHCSVGGFTSTRVSRTARAVRCARRR